MTNLEKLQDMTPEAAAWFLMAYCGGCRTCIYKKCTKEKMYDGTQAMRLTCGRKEMEEEDSSCLLGNLAWLQRDAEAHPDDRLIHFRVRENAAVTDYNKIIKLGNAKATRDWQNRERELRGEPTIEEEINEQEYLRSEAEKAAMLKGVEYTEEEWEWEYVDENGNPIPQDESNADDEDWEWEYVEDDSSITEDNNKPE